ncbi:RBSK-like protein [Mya arenaria]|uniref:Ribokinase n=1 Tax=Mya arenaria TaxID=6604 RepID=A0ABY7F9N7_MYAAR|nr:RBSK-like protein [Mya arenaria]
MDVTVVGSCNIDLISYVPRLPKPGETLQGSKFSMGFGGKGANQCVMTAKLGAKTAMVGKVGKDTFGEDFLKNFNNLGVDTTHCCTTAEVMTGAAPICVDETGQNSIVIVPGANLLLSEADLAAAELVIAGSKVVVCQLEINPDVTLAALKMAKQHKVRTILNPAPAIPLKHEFFENTDIICPNETESVDDAKRACKELQARGCGSVVVTLGAQGLLVSVEKDAPPTHVPAPSVHVVDTTGAGDSFIGALAFFLSTRPDLGLVESCRRAVQIASISVQAPGTQTSFPTRSQLPQELFL